MAFELSGCGFLGSYVCIGASRQCIMRAHMILQVAVWGHMIDKSSAFSQGFSYVNRETGGTCRSPCRNPEGIEVVAEVGPGILVELVQVEVCECQQL